MPSIILRRHATNDEQMGTSFDQSLSGLHSDDLWSRFLAQRHVGYPRPSHLSHAAMVGSFRGCHGPLAGSMVPFRPATTDGEHLCSSEAHLQALQWNSVGATVVQSSMGDQMEATSPKKRKRHDLVEPHPKHIQRNPKGALGDIDLGEEAPLSNARVLCRGQKRQQRGRMAATVGTPSGHASLENSRREWNGDSSLSSHGRLVPTLAGHQQPSDSQALRPKPLAVGREGGTTPERGILPFHVLRVVGRMEEKSTARTGEKQQKQQQRGGGGKRRIIEGPNEVSNEVATDTTKSLHVPINVLSKGAKKKQKPQKGSSGGGAAGSTSTGSKKKEAASLSNQGGRVSSGDEGWDDDAKKGSSSIATTCNPSEHLGNAWNDFFFARTSDLGTVATIRTVYALVVVVNVSLLLLDLDWFLRVMPTPLARDTMDPDTATILVLFEDTIFWPKVCVWLWLIHAILLGLGIKPQWQAFGVFFYQVQMAHHNALLWNGEDFIMRLLAFFLIFFPNSHSVFDLLRRRQPAVKSWPMWPFRLVQIQMCLIYFSTGGLKWGGRPWVEGFALYQVVHNDALYGCWFNPEWMFGYTRPLKFLTRATVRHELGIIPLLWFRATRKKALVGVILFHFSLDLTMNLNTFHYIMIVGWCSFLIQPDLPPARLAGTRSYNSNESRDKQVSNNPSSFSDESWNNMTEENRKWIRAHQERDRQENRRKS